MKNNFGPVAQWFSETLGHMAAAYRLHLAKANAQAAAEAILNQQTIFAQNWGMTILGIAYEAIRATEKLTHLVVPDSQAELMKCAVSGITRVPYIEIRLWQRLGYSETASAQDIRRYIQAEMRRRCDFYGIPRIGVAVRVVEKNRAIFRFYFPNDQTGA